MLNHVYTTFIDKLTQIKSGYQNMTFCNFSSEKQEIHFLKHFSKFLNYNIIDNYCLSNIISSKITVRVELDYTIGVIRKVEHTIFILQIQKT